MSKKEEIDPLAALLVGVIVGGYLLWVYVISPAVQWVGANSTPIIIGLVSVGVVVGVGFYAKNRRARSFELEQNARGLFKFVTFDGEKKWGTEGDIKKWEKEDEENRIYHSHINQVIRHIEEFEPTRRYNNEERYHLELQGHIKAVFPQSKIEVQTGASRPDIIVDNVAVEVKGPTSTRDLQTIADKLMRYSKYYDYNVVVLFDVQTNDRRYSEWEEGIYDTFGDVTVIRK